MIRPGTCGTNHFEARLIFSNKATMIDTTKRQELLETHHQSQVLRFWDELDSSQKEKLAAQIDGIDFDQLDLLISGKDQQQDFATMASKATTPPHVRADGSGVPWTIDQARQAGEQALREAKVAAIIVAGGQGTRLGFDKPKGMYPVGPVSDRTLFQFFADTLVAINAKYQTNVPWYVMTSEATDTETRAYFEAENYFGLGKDNVIIFKQGTMPAVDSQTGKLLLAEKDSLALSPDGHGGTAAALHRSGALADAKKRGITILSYIQVDNVLADLCDPVFLGHHILSQSEMTSQVIRKRYPSEKVGVIVKIDDEVMVIEYSDLPDAAAEAVDSQGELKLWAGSIAVHVIDIDFLERSQSLPESLPFHRANKKVTHLDDKGDVVVPQSPNATKFEKFIFDLLPQAKNAFVVETLPETGFAPVKNADGAETDTPALAKKMLSQLHIKWLRSVGAEVDDDAVIEINPRFALGPDDLKTKISDGQKIASKHFFDQ